MLIFAEVPSRKISSFYYKRNRQLFWQEGTEGIAPYFLEDSWKYPCKQKLVQI